MNIQNKNYNISDLQSFKDCNFYNTSGTFLTVSDFIASFEEKEQITFNVVAYHQMDATAEEIEKSILSNALLTIGDRERNEGTHFEGMGTIETLVKLSSCTHYTDKYDPVRLEKIKEFTLRQNGKWYFQPDQRCKIVNEFCSKDSNLACEVKPYKEYSKKAA